MVKFVQITHNFMNYLKSKVCFGTHTNYPSSKSSLNRFLGAFKFLLSCFAFVGVFFIHGCSDEPVSVDKQIFRTQQFNWQTTEIQQGNFSDIWADESNVVYMLSFFDKSLYKLSDKTLSQFYAGEYNLYSMDAVSRNAIFIFGISQYLQITFVKWNGSGFEYIPSGVFLNQYGGSGIQGCAIDQDEAWICSQKGIVRNQGGNITTYDYPDSSMVPKEIFKSPGGNIQIICENYVQGRHIQKIYELQNNTFTEIYDLSEPYPESTTRTLIGQLNGIVFQQVYKFEGASASICLKSYVGSAFNEMYCLGNKINMIRKLDGNIFGELILYGETYQGPYQYPKRQIFTWNGTFLSREIEMPNPSMITDYNVIIKSVNPDLVHIMHNWEGFTKILTGTRK